MHVSTLGKNRKKQALILTLTVVGLALVCLLVFEYTGLTHVFRESAAKHAVSGSPATKGEPTPSSPGLDSSNQPSQTNSAPSGTQPGDQKSESGGAATTAALISPSGNFVSNHRPNLSGNPAPASETSVCTTTPGASCSITFTKDGITKSLTPQTTDRGGSAYWNWKLQDIGLTGGSWHIQAIASLGDQTKTADDALNLQVSP